MPEVKERPILFSGPMVRAILDGQKTVTRRAVKTQPRSKGDIGSYGVGQPFIRHPDPTKRNPECPYGRPGDRLWVRETWGVISHTWNEHGDMVDWVPDRPATAIRELPFGRGYYSGHVIYAADGANEWAGDDDGGGEPRSAWHPSIHMPRLASRILLEVTSIRVERLQDITEAQAKAEGVLSCERDIDEEGNGYSPLELFGGLWTMIHGTESWHANPWVWVVEFKRVTP